MISKRIQKHLIDRADDMWYRDENDTYYQVDTYLDAIGRIMFMVYAHNEHSGMTDHRSITLVEDLQEDMKSITGDMRKWHVRRNGL